MGTLCAVCGSGFEGTGALAEHLVAEAERSDVGHVMWLNRNVTKHQVSAERLAELLVQSGGEERVRR